MDKFVNNSFVSFLFAPLATFDQMLRMFGGKSANGEGYLYNRFMRGWVDARQKEIKENSEGKAYAYEVTNIELLEDHKELAISNSAKSNNPNGVELLDSTDGERPGLSSSYQSNSNGRSNVSDVFVSGAKLLNNLEKSYDTGKNCLTRAN